MNWVRGAGYDSESGQVCDMAADDNNDNKVSIIELRDYTNDRLETMRPAQTCQIFSENDDEIIFE